MQKSIRAATSSLKSTVVLPGLVHTVVAGETKAQEKLGKQKTNHLESWKPDFPEKRADTPGLFTFRSDGQYDLPAGITADMLKSQNGVHVGNSESLMQSTFQVVPSGGGGSRYISSSQEKKMNAMDGDDDYSTTMTEHTTQFGVNEIGGSIPPSSSSSSSSLSHLQSPGGLMHSTSPSLGPSKKGSSSGARTASVDPMGIQASAVAELESAGTFKAFAVPCCKILTECVPLPPDEMKALTHLHKNDPSKLGEDFWATICWHSTIDRLNKECDSGNKSRPFNTKNAVFVLNKILSKYKSYDQLPDWVVTELFPRNHPFVRKFIESKFEDRKVIKKIKKNAAMEV